MKKVFYEEISTDNYKEIDQHTNRYFNSIFNSDNDIVYKYSPIRNIIIMGAIATAITVFSDPALIVNASVQHENPYEHTKSDISTILSPTAAITDNTDIGGIDESIEEKSEISDEGQVQILNGLTAQGFYYNNKYDDCYTVGLEKDNGMFDFTTISTNNNAI